MLTEALRKLLEEQGYIHITEKNRRVCAIFRFALSTGIVSEIDDVGYGNRWCYHEHSDAVRALEEWDGEGEPQGWHRHLPSMRRRNSKGEHIGIW